MTEKLRTFLRSLELRLLLPLSLTVAVVLAAHAVFSFRTTHAHFRGLVRDQIERTSTLILGATHDGMLLNRLEDVETTIGRLVEAPDVVAIRVYDKHGRVVLSAHPEERGRRGGLDSDTCQGCHPEDGVETGAIRNQATLGGLAARPGVLQHLQVIENEPACSAAACHFHPGDERVLGVLHLEMSMAPLEAALVAAQRQLVLTTLALILISGAIGAMFIRWVIVRPVRQLEAGTRRVAAGDLDTCISVQGEHELARLASAFNGMIEDLRTARREVTEWSRTLEEKVEEKADELRGVQRQVLHMEKMASLGKLSATVAHELNNPISGMLTYARLVKRELAEQPLAPEVGQEIDRYLSLIDKECSRCGAIVHNLLSFSRQSGTELVSVDLNELVERSLMLVRHHLEISHVSLDSDRLDGASEIVADAGQLQQALVALFVNAVEAMSVRGVGGAVLTLRLRGTDEHVEIDVSDTGTGIAPDALPHIFEPFFSTKGDERGGVGLGLAVVYGIINRHGGSIEVESEPGRGTTFHLRLPRRPAPDDGGAARPTPGDA